MFAIFKRNFFAYFLNPTGYVFICAFVLLSSVAAFVPDEFVNSNLANLNQLNIWFPLITLVFTPAIAMNSWAEERRIGADELLTTQPISSFQIVIGKYFAANLIYTASLFFSAISNYWILRFLGTPDLGLLLVTYLGYWLVGSSMVALASIVSYLSSQLTVAYILGALICIPLTVLKWADAAPLSSETANILKSFSIESFFLPFGRGVVSLASTLYFLSIIFLSLYICNIILNRKKWNSCQTIRYRIRYLLRITSLCIISISIVGLVRDHDCLSDWTEEKLSELSPETIMLLDNNKPEYPIIIEARLSPIVPKEFVQTRLNVISVLNELKNRSQSQIFLDIRDVLPNTSEAVRLERQYDIRPKKVLFDSRGQLHEDSIFISIIFRCGSKTVIIPFLNKGLSVEYELVSSILNVSRPPKKRIGILKTDAGALGRVDDYGQEIQKPWPLIEELSKQYIVETVDPKEIIESDKYDVLIAFQPSSLTPLEMTNFSNVVRSGQPTAIFEDPSPVFLEFLPGTLEKRRQTPTNPIPPLKGEINMLWTALGTRFDGANILWKNYNPYPKLAGLSAEYLFVDSEPISYEQDTTDTENQNIKNSFATFNLQDPIVSRLERMLFPFVGSIKPAENAETTFEPLIQVQAGGYSSVTDIVRMGVRTKSAKRISQDGIYTLAAQITGAVPKAFRLEKSDNKAVPEFNVIIVADVDMSSPGFFTLREMGTDVRSGISFDFDNISFILNVVDKLAGNDSLIALRSRRPKHRALTRIEEATRKIKDKATLSQITLMKEFEAERIKEEAKLQKTIQQLSSSDSSTKELNREESLELQSAIVAAQQRLTKILDDKKRRFERRVEEEQREVDEFTRKIQGKYKAFAIIFPPMPPLIIGLIVYFYRKRRQGSTFGY